MMKSLSRIFFLFLICFFFNLTAQSKDKTTVADYKAISQIMQKGLDEAIGEKVNKAIFTFDKAYDLAKSKKHEELIPVILISQSRLIFLTNEFEMGLQKLMQAEPYLHHIENNSLYGDFYEYKAQYYLHLKKYDEALTALKLCETSRLKNEPTKNWRTYNGMARVYNKLDQKDKAEEYLQKADKLAKIQNAKRALLDLQNELQFDEKNGTIAILSNENKKSKLELKKSEFQKKLFFSGLIGFLLLSSFLFIIIKQRNKINKEITKRNELITKNLEEKEYLIKEIHHRVKNNLQVISSLLSLQSRTVDDENAMQALNESQARVQSMTLIHQNLYKDGPTSHLDIKDYIGNLAQSLVNTYRVNVEKLALKIDLDSVLVDVGKLVPIGLIVNELITNSLKYAYHNHSNPILGISCKLENENLLLKVWDNGNKMVSTEKNAGFGNKLIAIFAKKLDATISRDTQNGTSVALNIPNIKSLES